MFSRQSKSESRRQNQMKRSVLFLAALALLFVPVAQAQNHGEVGAFVDYFRQQQTKVNFVGLGARAAFRAVPHVQIEAEMAYDFSRAFTESFTSGTGAVTLQNSNMKVLHGLFGPKLQTTGPVRVFVTVKGGFTNFRLDPRPASFSTFTSSVDNLRTNNVSGALYPGAGVEAFLGPFGLRLDVGDEIVFSNGARHNWKVTLGPVIRF
jgi:hypothetical protein